VSGVNTFATPTFWLYKQAVQRKPGDNLLCSPGGGILGLIKDFCPTTEETREVAVVMRGQIKSGQGRNDGD
jgi:hypothetical protein